MKYSVKTTILDCTDFFFLVKGYKDDWITKDAVAEDADPAENPAEGRQNKEVK